MTVKQTLAETKGTMAIAMVTVLLGCDTSIVHRDRSGSLETIASNYATIPSASQVREAPISLPVGRQGLFADWLNSDFPERFKAVVLKDQEKRSSSLCLHMVSAFGSEISLRTTDDAEEKLLDILLNQERAIEVLGHPTLFESNYGIRPYAHREAGRGSQAHHDQILCCLAQVGVRSSCRCNVNNRDRTVADLLADSEAEFYIAKNELAFTAIAYAHLLPPRQRWVNKYDEEFGFSDIVDELLSRDIGTSHCFGTHLFEAMIVIDRVDREISPILNPASRKRLEERIEELARIAVSRQQADGSWGSQWFQLEPLARNEEMLTQRSKLLVTGHLIQMLAKLPDRFEVEDYVFERGLRWLDMVTSQLSEDEMTREFCPCSHAAWCLKHFRTFGEPNSRAPSKEGAL
jgi:hypothetical protein